MSVLVFSTQGRCDKEVVENVNFFRIIRLARALSAALTRVYEGLETKNSVTIRWNLRPFIVAHLAEVTEDAHLKTMTFL